MSVGSGWIVPAITYTRAEVQRLSVHTCQTHGGSIYSLWPACRTESLSGVPNAGLSSSQPSWLRSSSPQFFPLTVYVHMYGCTLQYTLARTHARTCDAQWRYCKAGRLRHRIRTSGKSRSMSGESLPEEIVTLCAGAGRGRAPTTHTLIMMCHAQALCQHVSVARFA